MSDHFGTLCIKGLNEPISNLGKIATKIRPKEKKNPWWLIVSFLVNESQSLIYSDIV